jgi:hypothetical protein
MTADDARRHLLAASRLRMPRFDERDTDGMKIEKIENHLLVTAITRGDLEECRLHMQMALHDLQRQWDDIPREAWEVHAPKTEKARTQVAIAQAKRLIEPDLYDGIVEAKFLIARLTEQINRLSHMGDDQVASRIYSLLAGT